MPRPNLEKRTLFCCWRVSRSNGENARFYRFFIYENEWILEVTQLIAEVLEYKLRYKSCSWGGEMLVIGLPYEELVKEVRVSLDSRLVQTNPSERAAKEEEESL